MEGNKHVHSSVIYMMLGNELYMLIYSLFLQNLSMEALKLFYIQSALLQSSGSQSSALQHSILQSSVLRNFPLQSSFLQNLVLQTAVGAPYACPEIYNLICLIMWGSPVLLFFVNVPGLSKALKGFIRPLGPYGPKIAPWVSNWVPRGVPWGSEGAL